MKSIVTLETPEKIRKINWKEEIPSSLAESKAWCLTLCDIEGDGLGHPLNTPLQGLILLEDGGWIKYLWEKI